MAKLTLIGFYDYMKQSGNDIFINMTLPDKVDKQILTDEILSKGGEFPVLYSDPYFTQAMIGSWSRRNLRIFDRWSKALEQDYDALYNYDRYEDWTETDESKAKNAEGSTVHDSSETGTTGNSTGTVSAYNSSVYEPDRKTDTKSSATGKTDTQTDSASEGESSNVNHRTGRAYGNIGVTTSSAMLKEYLDIQAWDMYQHIVDLFISEFCIPVYE